MIKFPYGESKSAASILSATAHPASGGEVSTSPSAPDNTLSLTKGSLGVKRKGREGRGVYYPDPHWKDVINNLSLSPRCQWYMKTKMSSEKKRRSNYQNEHGNVPNPVSLELSLPHSIHTDLCHFYHSFFSPSLSFAHHFCLLFSFSA